MKINWLRICSIGAVLIVSQLFPHESAQAVQTTNSWTFNSNGKWETAADWSSGVPSVNQSLIQIINGTMAMVLETKATVIDQTTASSAPGSLTISNLLVKGTPGIVGTFNELVLSDTGAANLSILNTFTISTRGELVVTNSGIVFESGSDTVPMFAVDGVATLENGTISAATDIFGSYNGFGQVIGMNGAGTLTIQGGVDLVLLDSIALGLNPGSIGTVSVVGGELETSVNIDIGNGGVGSLNQSGGLVEAGEEDIGEANSGTLTMSGGTNFPGFLQVGVGATGTVWITGGTIAGGTNTFIQVNEGALTESNGVVEADGEDVLGTMTQAGGVQVLGVFGLRVEGAGAVWVTGGQLLVNNAFDDSRIDGQPGAPASLTQSNGTVELFGEIVGYFGPAVLTVAGGMHDVGFDGLTIGRDAGSTGTVWVTGGELLGNIFSSSTEVGDGGTGFLTQSNGTVDVFGEMVGDTAGSQGALTLVGGFHTVEGGGLIVGNSAGSAGSVSMGGGQLNVEGATVGFSGVGTMVVSNGTWLAEDVLVGGEGGQGTLTVAGGTSLVSSNLTIGTEDCTGIGTVIVAGGSLYVTNAAHNAVLEVASGTLVLSGGTLVVDQLVTTNPCASFRQTGGTLVIGGVTSSFQITAINREGNNVRITWTDSGGQTNVVQATNGLGGNYATNFTDLSSSIILQGSGNVTTNYLDVGGATNFPARFYRVRSAP